MPSGRENDQLTFDKEGFERMLVDYGFVHMIHEADGKTLHCLYQEAKTSEDIQDLYDYMLWEFDLR